MPAEWNLQGIEIKPNTELSPLDKAVVFLNYPFFREATSTDPNVNPENALATVDITGEFRDTITEEFNQGDWQGVRAEFTRWAVNQKAIADNARTPAGRVDSSA